MSIALPSNQLLRTFRQYLLAVREKKSSAAIQETAGSSLPREPHSRYGLQTCDLAHEPAQSCEPAHGFTLAVEP